MKTIDNILGGFFLELIFVVTRREYHFDLAIVDKAATHRSVDDSRILGPTAMYSPNAIPLRHKHSSWNGSKGIIDVSRASPNQVLSDRWGVSTRRVEAVQMPVKAATLHVALNDRANTIRRSVAAEANNGLLFLVDEPAIIGLNQETIAIFPEKG